MRLEEELLHMMDYQLHGRLQNICQIKEKCGAKTLFATHYHELIGLEKKKYRV